MLLALLIISAIVAFWWLAMLLSPAQRRLMHFVYGLKSSPDALNGGFPGDDVTAPFAGDPPEWPSVTIIVPGRNEGHLLAKTLGSLCAMDYPHCRVIFIDDQSTDNTAKVCRKLEERHPHLTVIHNQQPPRDGWIGKTWAVHQAEQYMHDGDYLLFADSDLEFHPQCLKQMVRLARHRDADIASSLPSIRYETPGELLGLISAITIVNARLNLYTCNNPRNPHALVAGGFLLVKRESYHALGGHAAVRGQVVEDVALGTRAKALGKRVFTVLTHDLFIARMYEGWADTYHGLKKNAYAGANYNPAFALFIGAFLLVAGVLPPLYAAAGIWLWVFAPSALSGAAAISGLAALALEIIIGTRTARFVGFRLWSALLLPTGFLFYLAVFIGSVVDYYRGGNTWAGRRLVQAQSLAKAGVVDEPVA